MLAARVKVERDFIHSRRRAGSDAGPGLTGMAGVRRPFLRRFIISVRSNDRTISEPGAVFRVNADTHGASMLPAQPLSQLAKVYGKVVPRIQ